MTDKGTVALWVVLGIAWTLFVVLVTLALSAPAPVSPLPVSCPTEDSCTVDYRGGAWHIEPVGDGR